MCYAALDVALTLVQRPIMVRAVRRSPLPNGVRLLLEVAAEETDALRTAQTMTGRSQNALQEAAGFFIEQVMLCIDANSYRVLGGSPASSRRELRRNMALLMKWLHPDGKARRLPRADLNRDFLIPRVMRAWEDLKTDERRARYDRSQAHPRKWKPPRTSACKNVSDGACRDPNPSGGSPCSNSEHWSTSRRLVVYRFERGSLWRRLLGHFGICS